MADLETPEGQNDGEWSYVPDWNDVLILISAVLVLGSTLSIGQRTWMLDESYATWLISAGIGVCIAYLALFGTNKNQSAIKWMLKQIAWAARSINIQQRRLDRLERENAELRRRLQKLENRDLMNRFHQL